MCAYCDCCSIIWKVRSWCGIVFFCSSCLQTKCEKDIRRQITSLIQIIRFATEVSLPLRQSTSNQTLLWLGNNSYFVTSAFITMRFNCSHRSPTDFRRSSSLAWNWLESCLQMAMCIDSWSKCPLAWNPSGTNFVEEEVLTAVVSTLRTLVHTSVEISHTATDWQSGMMTSTVSCASHLSWDFVPCRAVGTTCTHGLTPYSAHSPCSISLLFILSLARKSHTHMGCCHNICNSFAWMRWQFSKTLILCLLQISFSSHQLFYFLCAKVLVSPEQSV